MRSRRRSSPAAGTTLRHLAHGGITTDLEGAIRRGTDGASDYLDRSIVATLPTRGGFAGELARKTEMHRSKIPGGYRMTVDSKGSDAARINAGRLRHPVWGNRENWTTQTVAPHFADKALDQVKRDVDREIAKAMRSPGPA